jgi:hypothetical protein
MNSEKPIESERTDAVIVPLSKPLMRFLEKQAELEGKTPAQILIAAMLRTYNPRAIEDPPSEP